MPAQAWVTLAIGVVGFGGVFWTVRQRDRTDRRDQWWKRAAWAVDHTFSGVDERQTVGFAVLAQLQTSSLIGSEERELLTAFSLDQSTGDNAPDTGDNEGSNSEDGAQ